MRKKVAPEKVNNREIENSNYSNHYNMLWNEIYKTKTIIISMRKCNIFLKF